MSLRSVQFCSRSKTKQQQKRSYLTYSCPKQKFEKLKMQKQAIKESQNNKTLSKYIVHNKSYVSALQERNLHLNTTVNNLFADKLRIENQNHIQTQINNFQKDKLINNVQTKTSLIEDVKDKIYRMTIDSNFQKRITNSLEETLNMQFCKNQLESHEMSVVFTKLNLSLQQMTQQNISLKQQCQERVKIYEKVNAQLKQQIQKLKLTLQQYQLDEQFIQKRNKIKKYDNLEKQKHVSQILQLERRLIGLKIDKQELNSLNKILTTKVQQQQDQIRYFADKLSQMRDELQKYQIKPLKKEVQTVLNIQNPDKQKQIQKIKSLLSSMVTLRMGINHQIFQIFIKSVKKGEQTHTNAMKLFINNWRTFKIDRIESYVLSYIEYRKVIAQLLNKNSNYFQQLREVSKILPLNIFQDLIVKLPHHIQVNSPYVFQTHYALAYKQKLKTRTSINLWVLSTIQFTINQFQFEQKDELDKSLIFLFRILTIQYRIAYPKKGHRHQIDQDVWNCLLDQTVLAIHKVIQAK